MDKIKIIGGNQLSGKIYISGAKNAALPLICAALLTNDKVILKNVPALSDITFLNGLLKYLGIKFPKKKNYLNLIFPQPIHIRRMKSKSLLPRMILSEKCAPLIMF